MCLLFFFTTKKKINNSDNDSSFSTELQNCNYIIPLSLWRSTIMKICVLCITISDEKCQTFTNLRTISIILIGNCRGREYSFKKKLSTEYFALQGFLTATISSPKTSFRET